MSVLVSGNTAIVEEGNLSVAWVRAFQIASRNRNRDVIPITVSMTQFTDNNPSVNPDVEFALNLALRTGTRYGQTVSSVASTIFPVTLWNSAMPRSLLYKRFENIWPRIAQCRLNRDGHYFYELTHYQEGEGTTINQLESIIHIWNDWPQQGRPERKLLQATLVRPSRDFRIRMRSIFPCLHQISFLYRDDDRDGLYVTCYYPTQTLFESAYGNYLGMARLGKFMAQEMGLTLRRVTCMTGRAHIEVGVGVYRPLLERLNEIVPFEPTSITGGTYVIP